MKLVCRQRKAADTRTRTGRAVPPSDDVAAHLVIISTAPQLPVRLLCVHPLPGRRLHAVVAGALACKAEVAQLGVECFAAAADQHVGGLDVSVHHLEMGAGR